MKHFDIYAAVLHNKRNIFRMKKALISGIAVLIVSTACAQSAHPKRPNPDSLSVMTWNIWGRLNEDPRYTIGGKTARQRTIEILKQSQADIICMVEAYGSADDIAQALGFHYYTPGSRANLAIFSRYPLSNAGTLKGLSSSSFIVATAELPNGRKVRIYDVWLTSKAWSSPRDAKIDDEEIVAADAKRDKMLREFLQHPDVAMHLADKDIAIIVAGDFNSFSHLDYTAQTKEKGLNFGRMLPISVSKRMVSNGFVDTYRVVHPKVTEETLGHTWTTVGPEFHWTREKGFYPVEKNPAPEKRGLFCRIDYIYADSTLKPISSTVINHHPSNSDRCFPEFPSDHAAVITIFEGGEQ